MNLWPKCAWRLPTLMLLAVAIRGCSYAPRADAPVLRSGDEGQTLRVATLNLAHGRGVKVNPLGQLGLRRKTLEKNLAAVARAIRREAPDVIALQEADAASDWSGGFDHVAFLAEAAGYPHRHHGVHVDVDRGSLGLHYGTALLARRELAGTDSYAFAREPTDTRKGYVLAEIEFAGRPVTVVSVHLNSKSAAARKRQVHTLIEHLRRVKAALVILGDFNTKWESPDSALRLIAEELDLRPFQPDSDAQNTFPAPAPRWRLDWILISDQLRFRDQWRWPEQVSDHLGVTADLEWR